MADLRLTAKQFQDAGGLEDWRVLAAGASSWFDAPSHAAGAELMRGIVDMVGDGARRPDIDLRRAGIQVRIPFGPSGLTDADVSFARAISEVARGLRLRSDSAALQSVQLAIDAVDKSAVLPFWRTVFGYEEEADDLTDGLRRDPGIWFQQADQPRPLRKRIHVDVAWADDTANTRRAAVLVNGGHVVNDERPWVIDDPDGNEVCLPLGPPAALGDGPETEDWRQIGSAITCYPTASFRFVPDDQAQARIGAALAVGGRITYDAQAPAWWTMADPEGNEVDIAVAAGREELWQESR
ncbi:MAG TPA: VOC family protein [Mycobacteriales bacterium]|jgi:hypothetical protein|nr:VOC family protein [Mycobacteriales bacterium]